MATLLDECGALDPEARERVRRAFEAVNDVLTGKIVEIGMEPAEIVIVGKAIGAVFADSETAQTLGSCARMARI